VKHYGDITELKGYMLPEVEVVTGGSPCQDLSVAGKRAGLDGARSGLFMEQIRVIKEMRENDQLINDTEGADIKPRFMVWENVPGAFSSNKGEDFRAVLEETAKVCDETTTIPEPHKGKWHNSGAIMGDGWSIAWRVFDAQFWGVPQRRRRIYLVADFGGHTAPEILFKREGLPGYLAPSRIAGQGTTTDSEGGFIDAGGFDGRGRSGELAGVDKAYGVVSKGNGDAFLSDERHMSLGCGGGQAGQGYPCVLEPFVKSRRAKFQGDFETWVEGKVNPTLNNFDLGDIRTTTAVVEKDVFEWHNQDSRITGPIDTACTLNTNAGGREGHLVMDAPAYCLQGSMIGREEKNGPQGDGVNEEVCFTLNTIDRHAVNDPPITLQIRSGKEGGGKGPITQENLSATLTAGNTQYLFEPVYALDQQGGKGAASFTEDVAPTLLSDSHGTPHAVAYGISSYESNSMKSDNPLSGVYEAETSRTLDLNGGNPACNQGGIVVVDDRKRACSIAENGKAFASVETDHKGCQKVLTTYQNVTGCLDCGISKGTGNQLADQDMFVANQQSVRRLTPLECERLQGFPDGWTDIQELPEDLNFWRKVWDTFQNISGKKPKTDKAILTWLKNPTSDSGRYKALGNSVALPNTYFVLYGIAEQLGFKGTLGSLFDGIGGFPICWESICGKGTALWASEIEPFPIAVTKHHFTEED